MFVIRERLYAHPVEDAITKRLYVLLVNYEFRVLILYTVYNLLV